MKTLDFLKGLTGYDFTKENTNNYILRQIRQMLELRRQIEDEEAFEFLSSLSFMKRTIDKSNDDNFHFNQMDIYYAEKDEYKIIIRCFAMKNGLCSTAFNCSGNLGFAEGTVKHILKYHNLDLVQEYNKSTQTHIQEEEKVEPVKTTTIKELAEKLKISDRDLGWDLLDIIKMQQICNETQIVKFEIVRLKGARSEVIVKDIINK